MFTYHDFRTFPDGDVLLTAIQDIKREENRIWPPDMAEIASSASVMTNLLNVVKTAGTPAGIFVSAMGNALPFKCETKLHLVAVQHMVASHWSAGRFSIQVDRGLVERWMMKHDGKDWRVLCDEEGIIKRYHPNVIVSHLRWLQPPADKLRLGDGPIFGDCVIINNRCGW